MKIPQYPYMSPEADELRRRDNVPPWGVHPCECDDFDGYAPDNSGFWASLVEARKLRAQIEAEG